MSPNRGGRASTDCGPALSERRAVPSYDQFPDTLVAHAQVAAGVGDVEQARTKLIAALDMADQIPNAR